MALNEEQVENIKRVLKSSIRYKLSNYHPEPNSMPFHTRLLGAERLAIFSFIQSLNTNFGTTIFEPVAVEIAMPYFQDAQRQVKAGNQLSEAAQQEIQSIMNSLTTATASPNKPEEIERIRQVSCIGKMLKVKPTRVDLMLISHSSEVYMFDLKTAKPNANDFKGFKRTLLEWVAVTLAENHQARINTIIAIPYNPYEPKPYQRWTIRGMLDLDAELLVGKEFWDFLGGEGTYEQLLDIFEAVGIELRPEIDKRFSEFR